MPKLFNNKVFQDADKARAWLEAMLWPDGPVCGHCGTLGEATAIASRPGVYQCNACRKQFTVTVGTVFERSHIPLNKWLMAAFMFFASKKGISAHQMHRMLGVTYKSAWFMMHRLREAIVETDPGAVGGSNKVVEVDETYIGGKAKNRAFAKPLPKKAVVSLIERGGRVRSQHVANVTAKTLRPIITKHADRASYLMTDEAPVYRGIGSKDFDGRHGTVNHSIDEYVRGTFWHTNTIENFFSILKRGVYGTYQHVSEAHLHRYLAEFDFRHNERAALGVDDEARAMKALKGIVGKRLTYRRINEASHAQAAH